jgi:hypothetical protein
VPDRWSISPPRSSNRTCGFPATGVPTGLIVRPASVIQRQNAEIPQRSSHWEIAPIRMHGLNHASFRMTGLYLDLQIHYFGGQLVGFVARHYDGQSHRRRPAAARLGIQCVSHARLLCRHDYARRAYFTRCALPPRNQQPWHSFSTEKYMMPRPLPSHQIGEADIA